MTLDLLILAIVRQTTVLIAQLATSRGSRAALAQVASQVFLDLVRELERQGVSRKVSADMFGLGLRTFQRKVQRLAESSTERGRSLWVAILDFLPTNGSITRAKVMLHFADEDEALVRGILHDQCEMGLVVTTGTGPGVTYRRTSDDELAQLCQAGDSEGLDELLWALIYRGGPQTIGELSDKYGERNKIELALERLQRSGRVERSEANGAYRAQTLVVPIGAAVGWEAAVFDHFQAMVKTITCRLRSDRKTTNLADRIGGSTYTVDIWPGHPHAAETYATLAELRAKLGNLRERIERHNAEHTIPDNYEQVSLYVGQCVIPQEVTESQAGEFEAIDAGGNEVNGLR